LNVIVKGASSAGKNFLVSCVLALFPETATIKITSSSRASWNYARDAFRHKIVYIVERNEAAGGIHPARILISDRELRHSITVRKGGEWKREEFVAEGPIAAISTSTRDRLQIDDENRHISCWMDESPDQTRRIIQSQRVRSEPLTKDEIETWHEVYRLIAQRASAPIKFPEWFKIVEDNAYADNIRLRRYYPAFTEAVRTIALIRSFTTNADEFGADDVITVRSSDYAIATLIFEDIFVDSLCRGDEESDATRTAVGTIEQQRGEAVDANQLAGYLGCSQDKAYSKLRTALEAGTIVRANEPEKNNNKRYRVAPRVRFVPSIEEVRQKLKPLKKPISFTHPLTGENATLVKQQRKRETQ
jgi:hypothetical protein